MKREDLRDRIKSVINEHPDLFQVSESPKFVKVTVRNEWFVFFRDSDPEDLVGIKIRSLIQSIDWVMMN